MTQNFRHINNLLACYPKEYALRELTQLYSFTGLKIVHKKSDNNQKGTIGTNCLPQILETKDTRQKSQKLKNKKLPQKPRKNRKIEKNFTTGNQRNLSRPTIITISNLTTKRLENFHSTV